MIHLDRLAEPDILNRLGAIWLQRFIESGKDRPLGSNTTYGHPDIRRTLMLIGHNKCYYCERLLKDLPSEIDHYIEIAFEKRSAFTWDNLFLACDNCNGKLSQNDIPVTEALNPFINSNEEIEGHIHFEGEIIRKKNNSQIGDNTIKKFKLSSPQLDGIRAKYLNNFYDEYSSLLEKLIGEGRGMNNEERESILRYSYSDHPFSLMFKILLKKKQLI